MTWLVALRRYLGAVAAGNLVWEAAHMPLYGVWATGTPRELALYGLHCTAGDVLIAGSALLLALFLFGGPGWPRERYAAVAAWAVAFGLAYTAASEWVNVHLSGSWTYADAMPVLPGLGIGLSPLAQWLVVPTLAFLWVRRR